MYGTWKVRLSSWLPAYNYIKYNCVQVFVYKGGMNMVKVTFDGLDYDTSEGTKVIDFIRKNF